MTTTREDYAVMDPEAAIDELYAMVQLLAGGIASKTLLREQSGYSVPQLATETEKWVVAAQQAHRLSESIPAPTPPADTPCNHDVTPLGDPACLCLRPWGHQGPHECGHNLGRFSKGATDA